MTLDALFGILHTALSEKLIVREQNDDRLRENLAEQTADYRLLRRIGRGTHCADGREGALPGYLEWARRYPGLYALSNHLLDTPWPKVTQAKSRLAEALNDLPKAAAMLDLLRDAEPATDEELPRTGVSLEMERMLSSAFIHGEAYGTRCSTIMTCGTDGGIAFSEWSWDEEGALAGMARYHFQKGAGP